MKNKKRKHESRRKQRKEKIDKREIQREPEKSSRLGSKNLQKLLVIGVSCILVASFGIFLYSSSVTTSDTGQGADVDVHKAAILDGLYDTSPNATFIEALNSDLQSTGYVVDVFRGKDVTIPLLRRIGGYQLIILRLHSAVHDDGFLYLFSGERYDPTRYVLERASRTVREGVTFENESFFAIKALFLGASSGGGLNGSSVILMGCSGTGDPLSIDRLFDNGVKEYVGWTGLVDLAHTDEATLALVKAAYLEDIGLEQGVEAANAQVGPDPLYSSVMQYFP